MSDKLTKIPKKAGWQCVQELTVEKVYKTHDGRWVSVIEAGGWGGVMDGHQGRKWFTELSPSEAFKALFSWGVDEKFLERHIPEFLPADDEETP